MSKKPYFIGLNRRAMISLGPIDEKAYCAYKCSFCYVRGPFPKNKRETPEDIVSWLERNRSKFDIVYISGDTDSFAPTTKGNGVSRTDDALELLRRLIKLNVDVLFTTRYVFTSQEIGKLKKIVKSFKRNDNLLIGCVSVCQLTKPKLEPGRIASPEERIQQLCTLKNIGITTVLAIRPLITSILPSEYKEIALRGANFSDVILSGDLYIDSNNNVNSRLEKTLKGEWSKTFFENIQEEELDFTDSTDKWYRVPYDDAEKEIRKVCDSKNIPFYMRSIPAIEYLKENKKYFLAQTNYKFFHSACLASLTHQLEVTNKFCKTSEDLWGNNIKGLKEFIATYIPAYKSVGDSDPTIHEKKDSESFDGSQLTDSFNAEFQILQEELSVLFWKNFPDWKTRERDAVNKVLKADLEDLRYLFGSKTSGLDAFVGMKRALLTRDKREVAKAEWLVSLIARTEKILRDLVCNTIYNVGAEIIVERAIVKCINEFEDLDSPMPPDSSNSKNKKATAFYDEIASCFSKYMSTKTENTFSLARYFFHEIYQTDERVKFSSRQNMCRVLNDLGDNEESITNKILHLRGVALHERNFSKFNEDDQSGFSEVVEWSQSRCRLVTQFVNSISAEYTLIALSSVTISKNNKGNISKIIPILSKKSQFEIRELNLSFLKRNLYWYAWFLSEATEKYFGGNKTLMLKLNSAYASKKLSEFENFDSVFNKELVPEQGPYETWQPRYKLIQISLLGTYLGAKDLMIEAFESGDMSIDELKSWPALEYLRETIVFKKTIDYLESR